MLPNAQPPSISPTPQTARGLSPTTAAGQDPTVPAQPDAGKRRTRRRGKMFKPRSEWTPVQKAADNATKHAVTRRITRSHKLRMRSPVNHVHAANIVRHALQVRSHFVLARLFRKQTTYVSPRKWEAHLGAKGVSAIHSSGIVKSIVPRSRLPARLNKLARDLVGNEGYAYVKNIAG